jgi:hypothetical protein
MCVTMRDECVCVGGGGKRQLLYRAAIPVKLAAMPLLSCCFVSIVRVCVHRLLYYLLLVLLLPVVVMMGFSYFAHYTAPWLHLF